MKNNIRSLFFVAVGLICATCSYAQTNCSLECYPYLFCLPSEGTNNPHIGCVSCPQDFAEKKGYSVYRPGLPCKDGTRIDDQYDDVIGISTALGTAVTYTPDSFTLALSWALSQYQSLCTPTPYSSCCLTIVCCTDPKVFKAYSHVATKDPAFSYIPINSSDCTIACDGTFTPATYINFTNDFLTDGDGGDPTEYAQQGFFDDGQISSMPTFAYLWGTGLKFWSIDDVIMHELAHFLGYPDEGIVAQQAPGCALDGWLQDAGLDWDQGTTGLTAREKCWFKQLYCPEPCTGFVETSCSGVASVSNGAVTPDPFSLISVSTINQSSTIQITYSLSCTCEVRYGLYDVLGKLLRPEATVTPSIGLSTIEVPVSGFPVGTYYLRADVGGNVHTIKIINSK